RISRRDLDLAPELAELVEGEEVLDRRLVCSEVAGHDAAGEALEPVPLRERGGVLRRRAAGDRAPVPRAPRLLVQRGGEREPVLEARPLVRRARALRQASAVLRLRVEPALGAPRGTLGSAAAQGAGPADARARQVGRDAWAARPRPHAEARDAPRRAHAALAQV